MEMSSDFAFVTAHKNTLTKNVERILIPHIKNDSERKLKR
jgi:hypothetical protein